jgi:hypothetical protein
MTENTTVTGSPEPGPDTFNFEDYLEGKSTFPEFDHVAYIDQRSGAELADVSDTLDDLVEELDKLDKVISDRSNSPASGLVDPVLDQYLNDRDTITSEIEQLQKRKDELRVKILSTAIKLTFQVKTSEELGEVTRAAARKFLHDHPNYKNASEDDLEYMTARTRYTLAAQISHFCIRMTLSDGRVVAPPTPQGAEKLMRKLISSEMVRLMESVGTGLSASREWASKLDAGFPGGGSDVEDVKLVEARTEDSQSLGDSPAPDADREAV